MSKKKGIKTPDILDGKRITTPASVQSTNHLHPAFCFRHVQSEFSIGKCDRNTQALLSQKLEELGRLNWNQIQSTSRKGKGHEVIQQNSIRAPQAKIPGDRDYLSFRLGKGKNSVFIGYRVGKVFYIVWIDPNGEVYSHGS